MFKVQNDLWLHLVVVDDTRATSEYLYLAFVFRMLWSICRSVLDKGVTIANLIPVYYLRKTLGSLQTAVQQVEKQNLKYHDDSVLAN